MPIDDRQAKQLCTRDEYALYRTSRNAKDLVPKDRDSKLRRARALRDKYRDLLRRQTRKARGKAGARPRPLEEATRTQAKAQLFAETVERLSPEPEPAPAPAAQIVRRASPPPSRSTRSILGSAAPRSTRSIHGVPPALPGKAVKKVYTKNRFAHYGSATHGRQRRRDARR